jgi:hypothetical protein
MRFLTSFLAMVMVLAFSLAVFASPTKFKVDIKTGDQVGSEKKAEIPQSMELLTAFRFINDDRADAPITTAGNTVLASTSLNVVERSIAVQVTNRNLRPSNDIELQTHGKANDESSGSGRPNLRLLDTENKTDS